jgi:hypothetical protein
MSVTNERTSGSGEAAFGNRFQPSAGLAHKLLDSAFPSPVETSRGSFHIGATEELFTASGAGERSMVRVAQDAITERLERMFSTIGFDAVARREPKVIADSRGFDLDVRRQVLSRLPLVDQRDEFLQSLHKELREFLRNGGVLRGDWGSLAVQGDRVVLLPAEPRSAAQGEPRVRATVVARNAPG